MIDWDIVLRGGRVIDPESGLFSTAFELEAGVTPVDAAYRSAAAEGRPVSYGFAASWALARNSAACHAMPCRRSLSWRNLEDVAVLGCRLTADGPCGRLARRGSPLRARRVFR